MNYGMYTKKGNALIHGIVMTAVVAELNWDQVFALLKDASTLKGFEEATDTWVRDVVYSKLYGE